MMNIVKFNLKMKTSSTATVRQATTNYAQNKLRKAKETEDMKLAVFNECISKYGGKTDT
jgi:hypothetical protein